MRAYRLHTAALLGLAAALACGGDEGPVVTASVQVSPGADSIITLGRTKQFTARVEDSKGRITSKTIEWRSLTPSVATIDAATGIATAVANGTSTITATAEGVTGSATLKVSQHATRVVIIAFPTGATAGRPFTPVLQVEIEDAGGARLSGATDAVAITFGANPGSAMFTGTSSANAVGGVASFSGLAISKAGMGYRLAASATGLSGALGSAFDVAPAHGPLTKIAPGLLHTCAIAASGGTYCWGGNSSGQLGDGTTTTRPYPELVSGSATFVAVASGAHHSCGITAGNVVYCWGSNAFGQLGDGSATNRPAPVPVAGGVSFSAVSAGFYHTCAIAVSGVVYCWGYNSDGQLGDGSTADHAAPAPVAGSVVFNSVSAGGSHTCALTGSGDVYCWGDNSLGQLGDGTQIGQLSPELIADSLTFGQVSAGEFHTCGMVTPINTVYCWGSNSNGQLGDGTTTDRKSPVLTGESYASNVTAGGLHTCIAATSVRCWGYNAFGELGDGTNTDRGTATSIAVNLGFVTIAVAGLSHTCALTNTSTAYCWGDNLTGQLGDGTTTSRNSPTLVGP